jgi:hypothetical integral membrane protein (TIGR02206 family)
MTNGFLLISLIVPTTFRPWHAQHITALTGISALCILTAWAAKRLTVTENKWLGRLIAFILIGFAAAFYIQQGMAHSLDLRYSLPLELCYIVLIACIISLFRPSQFGSEIAYYWGLGGVLQALATPDLANGFPSWEFILFFWSHGTTLLAIVFIIAGQNFRPQKGSIARMMITLNLYGLTIGTLDAALGWNYGYLCQKPAVPSLLDFLGPWPWYLLSLEVVAILIFLLLSLPWRLFRR